MSIETFKFTAEHFWKLVEKQRKRCALTNRELTPISCEVELREPDKKENRFHIDNFYLVDHDLKFLCRHLSESEIIELCASIIEHRGKDFGYKLGRMKK